MSESPLIQNGSPTHSEGEGQTHRQSTPAVGRDAVERVPTGASGGSSLARREFLRVALTAGLGAAGYATTAPAANEPVKVRLGTLAPKGTSYVKHLQQMGEKWRALPGGAVSLTIYPDGTMG